MSTTTGLACNGNNCPGRARPARQTRARPNNAWLDWTVDAGADDPSELVAALEAAGLTSEDMAA